MQEKSRCLLFIHGQGGRKYCRRCEIYLFHEGVAADYPNKDLNSVKFIDVKALKGGAFSYVHITGTLLSLSNRTLCYPAPIVYLFDKNNQSVGEVTNGLFVSTQLPPHTSGTFDVNIDPSMLKAEPKSYQLRFTGTFQ